ncbi:hypothetical protein HDU76_005546, partial [Blyttiomyces sp. JEL0837]
SPSLDVAGTGQLHHDQDGDQLLLLLLESTTPTEQSSTTTTESIATNSIETPVMSSPSTESQSTQPTLSSAQVQQLLQEASASASAINPTTQSTSQASPPQQAALFTSKVLTSLKTLVTIPLTTTTSTTIPSLPRKLETTWDDEDLEALSLANAMATQAHHLHFNNGTGGGSSESDIKGVNEVVLVQERDIVDESNEEDIVVTDEGIDINLKVVDEKEGVDEVIDGEGEEEEDEIEFQIDDYVIMSDNEGHNQETKSKTENVPPRSPTPIINPSIPSTTNNRNLLQIPTPTKVATKSPSELELKELYDITNEYLYQNRDSVSLITAPTTAALRPKQQKQTLRRKPSTMTVNHLLSELAIAVSELELNDKDAVGIAEVFDGYQFGGSGGIDGYDEDEEEIVVVEDEVTEDTDTKLHPSDSDPHLSSISESDSYGPTRVLSVGAVRAKRMSLYSVFDEASIAAGDQRIGVANGGDRDLDTEDTSDGEDDGDGADRNGKRVSIHEAVLDGGGELALEMLGVSELPTVEGSISASGRGVDTNGNGCVDTRGSLDNGSVGSNSLNGVGSSNGTVSNDKNNNGSAAGAGGGKRGKGKIRTFLFLGKKGRAGTDTVGETKIVSRNSTTTRRQMVGLHVDLDMLPGVMFKSSSQSSNNGDEQVGGKVFLTPAVEKENPVSAVAPAAGPTVVQRSQSVKSATLTRPNTSTTRSTARAPTPPTTTTASSTTATVTGPTRRPQQQRMMNQSLSRTSPSPSPISPVSASITATFLQDLPFAFTPPSQPPSTVPRRPSNDDANSSQRLYSHPIETHVTASTSSSTSTKQLSGTIHVQHSSSPLYPDMIPYAQLLSERLSADAKAPPVALIGFLYRCSVTGASSINGSGSMGKFNSGYKRFGWRREFYMLSLPRRGLFVFGNGASAAGGELGNGGNNGNGNGRFKAPVRSGSDGDVVGNVNSNQILSGNGGNTGGNNNSGVPSPWQKSLGCVRITRFTKVWKVAEGSEGAVGAPYSYGLFRGRPAVFAVGDDAGGGGDDRGSEGDGNRRVWYFCADTEEDRKRWMDAVEKLILECKTNPSSGPPTPFPGLSPVFAQPEPEQVSKISIPRTKIKRTSVVPIPERTISLPSSGTMSPQPLHFTSSSIPVNQIPPRTPTTPTPPRLFGPNGSIPVDSRVLNGGIPISPSPEPLQESKSNQNVLDMDDDDNEDAKSTNSTIMPSDSVSIAGNLNDRENDHDEGNVPPVPLGLTTPIANQTSTATALKYIEAQIRASQLHQQQLLMAQRALMNVAAVNVANVTANANAAAAAAAVVAAANMNGFNGGRQGRNLMPVQYQSGGISQQQQQQLRVNTANRNSIILMGNGGGLAGGPSTVQGQGQGWNTPVSPAQQQFPMPVQLQMPQQQLGSAGQVPMSPIAMSPLTISSQGILPVVMSPSASSYPSPVGTPMPSPTTYREMGLPTRRSSMLQHSANAGNPVMAGISSGQVNTGYRNVAPMMLSPGTGNVGGGVVSDGNGNVNVGGGVIVAGIPVPGSVMSVGGNGHHQRSR